MDFPFPRKKHFFHRDDREIGFLLKVLWNIAAHFFSIYLSIFWESRHQKKAFDGHESRCEKNKKKEKHRNPCTKRNAKIIVFQSFSWSFAFLWVSGYQKGNVICSSHCVFIFCSFRETLAFMPDEILVVDEDSNE